MAEDRFGWEEAARRAGVKLVLQYPASLAAIDRSDIGTHQMCTWQIKQIALSGSGQRPDLLQAQFHPGCDLTRWQCRLDASGTALLRPPILQLLLAARSLTRRLTGSLRLVNLLSSGTGHHHEHLDVFAGIIAM